MSGRQEPIRCEDCRRRFGGWEGMRRHQTSLRCKTRRELARDGHLVERSDGVWVQVHPSKVVRQQRFPFRLGRPRPPRNQPSRVRARERRENATATKGTTNAEGSQDVLFMLGGAA